MEKVAIIGSGVIGRQWSALFLAADYEVRVYDTSESQLQIAADEIAKLLNQAGELGLARRSQKCVGDLMKNVHLSNSLKWCLEDVVYVQECVPEVLSVKLEIWKDIDNSLASLLSCLNVSEPAPVLASSTSTIPASKLSSALSIKNSRFLVAHPINPPTFCRLVELVPWPGTDQSAVHTAFNIMKKLGQAPVVIKKDVQGFALNRLQYALLAESWRLVKDGIVDAEGLSTIMTEGLAPRYAFYSPLEVVHMNASGIEDYAKRYNAGFMATCQTFGPIPSLEDETTLCEVKRQLELKMPTEKLPEIRQIRDAKLAALAKLKRSL